MNALHVGGREPAGVREQQVRPETAEIMQTRDIGLTELQLRGLVDFFREGCVRLKANAQHFGERLHLAA